MRLWFVETQTFTKRIERLGLDPDLRALQEELLANPEAGDTDAGTGGLRKIRMTASAKGKGKRGGARVHYLWLPTHQVIYLLFVYGKGDQGSLDLSQRKQLKRVVEKIKAEWK